MNHSQEKALKSTLKMAQHLELVAMDFEIAPTVMVKDVKKQKQKQKNTLSLTCGFGLSLS